MIHTAGYQHISNCAFNLSTQPAPAKYMALTTDNTAPAAGDTSLASEITANSGLARTVVGTLSYNSGTKVTTLANTFTAAATGLPITVKKFGVFNASSAGTMVTSDVFSADAVMSASGDQLTVTKTITMS